MSGYRPQSQLHGQLPSQAPYARPGSVPYGIHAPTSPTSPWNGAHALLPQQSYYQYANIPQPLPPPPPGPPPALANNHGPGPYGHSYGKAGSGYGQQLYQPPQIPQPYNQSTSSLPPRPRPQSQAPLNHPPQPAHGGSQMHVQAQEQSTGGAHQQDTVYGRHSWTHESADPSEDLYSPPLPPRPASQVHNSSKFNHNSSIDGLGDTRQRRYSQAPPPPPKPVRYVTPSPTQAGQDYRPDSAPPSASQAVQNVYGAAYSRQRSPSRHRRLRSSTHDCPVSPLQSQENVILDRPVSAIGVGAAPAQTSAAQPTDNSSAFALCSDWEHFGSGAYEIDDTAMYGLRDDGPKGENLATVELPADSSTSKRADGDAPTALGRGPSSSNVMFPETAPAQHGTPSSLMQIASSSGSESSRRKSLPSGGVIELAAASQRRQPQSSSSPARQQSKRASNAAVASSIVEDAYQTLERPPSRGRPASDVRRASLQPFDPATGTSRAHGNTAGINRANDDSPLASNGQVALDAPKVPQAESQDFQPLEKAQQEFEELKARLANVENALEKAHSESKELASEVEQKDFLLSAKDAEIEMLQRSSNGTDLQRKLDEVSGRNAALKESLSRLDAELKQANTDKESMISKLQPSEATRDDFPGEIDGADGYESKIAELKSKLSETVSENSKLEQDLNKAASTNEDLSKKLEEFQDQLLAYEATSTTVEDQDGAADKAEMTSGLSPQSKDSWMRYKEMLCAESKITPAGDKKQLFLDFVHTEAELRGIDLFSDTKKSSTQSIPLTRTIRTSTRASIAEPDGDTSDDTDDGVEFSPGGRPILINAWTQPSTVPEMGASEPTASRPVLAKGSQSSGDPALVQAKSNKIPVAEEPVGGGKPTRLQSQASEKLLKLLSQPEFTQPLADRVSELSAVLAQVDTNHDFKTMSQKWEAEASVIRSKLEGERTQRQTDVEKRNNELFDSGEIGYGDFGTLESQAKEEEIRSKEEEDKREFESYVEKVFDTAYRRCSDDLVKLSDMQEDIEPILSELKARENFTGAQAGGLSGAIELLMRCYDAIEKAHLELKTTVHERDRRYKLTQTKPLYARGDVAGMKRVERAFEDADKKSELKSLVERTERCKRAWKIIGAHMRSGIKWSAEYSAKLLAAAEEVAEDEEDQRLPKSEIRTLLDRIRDAVASVCNDISLIVKTFGLIDMALNNCEYDVSVASARLKGKEKDFFVDLELEKKKEDAKLAGENQQRLKGLEEQKHRFEAELAELTKRVDEQVENAEK